MRPPRQGFPGRRLLGLRGSADRVQEVRAHGTPGGGPAPREETQVPAGDRRCGIRAHGSLALPELDRRPQPRFLQFWGERNERALLFREHQLSSGNCPQP